MPADGDNAIADFSVTWGTPASDWDIELFQDTNGNGAARRGRAARGGSRPRARRLAEQIVVSDPAGAYVLRVTNFAAVEDYSVTVTFKAPQAARTESYTLTCTIDGAVVKTSQVVVERAAVARVEPCPAAGGQAPPPTPVAVPAPTGTAVKPCAPVAALAVQAERARADRARAGSRCPGSRRRVERRVARFTNRWSKTARDGYYVVARHGNAGRVAAVGREVPRPGAVRARDVQRAGPRSAGRCSAGR